MGMLCGGWIRCLSWGGSKSVVVLTFASVDMVNDWGVYPLFKSRDSVTSVKGECYPKQPDVILKNYGMII